MNFAFVNIFYLNNVWFGVDNVKTINGTYSRTIMHGIIGVHMPPLKF